jgi:hypothetical protein
MGEIDVTDRFAGLIKDCPTLKLHDVESWAQIFPIVTIECSEEPVSAVEVVFAHRGEP